MWIFQISERRADGLHVRLSSLTLSQPLNVLVLVSLHSGLGHDYNTVIKVIVKRKALFCISLF